MASSSSAASSGSGSVLLSLSEQEFIRQGCQADCRADGRAATDFRTFYIETGGPQQPVLLLSHGSARLLDSTGALQMLCSVKAELVHPTLNAPTAGSIEIAIDEHASVSSSRKNTLREQQAALQHRLQWMDLQKLCVIPGAAVWRLYVDLYILSTTSGTTAAAWLDAASHCIRTALHHTVLPCVTVADDDTTTESSSSSSSTKKNVLDRLLVDSDIRNARPVIATVEEAPVIVTVHVIPSSSSSTGGGTTVLVLDATAEEEAVSTAAVHVAVRVQQQQQSSSAVMVSAVWKSGSGSLPMALLPACVQAAVRSAPTAVQHYKLQQQQIHSSTSSSSHRILLQEPLIIQ
jgi:exosome complex component RRP42